MTTFKKTISFILAMMMALSVFPMSAFAVEEEVADITEASVTEPVQESEQEPEEDSVAVREEPEEDDSVDAPEEDTESVDTLEKEEDEAAASEKEKTEEAEETEITEHTHSVDTLKHIDANAPTCETDGNIEYWYCEECDLCFVMEEDTLTEAEKENVVLAKGGHSFDETGICSVCGTADTNYIFEQNKTVEGVKVSVSAGAGVFPGGSTLSVETINLEEKKNQDVAEAVEEEREENKTVQSSYAFDIKVLDKDGNEIQPNGEVKVSFELDEISKNMDPELSVDVYHVTEEKNNLSAEVIDEQNIEVDKTAGEVIVETDGFSYYIVEFTKVDETTGETYQYVLQGDTKVALSEILGTLQIEEKEIQNVTVSNSELFEAKLEDGVWYVYALQAFHTTESLVVTFIDNEVCY